jgi:hypothetical protein
MIVGRAHAVAVCLALLMLTVGCVREHNEPADPWPVRARIAIAGTVTTNTNTPCLIEDHPEPCVDDVGNFLEVATEHGLVRLWYDHGESDRACDMLGRRVATDVVVRSAGPGGHRLVATPCGPGGPPLRGGRSRRGCG